MRNITIGTCVRQAPPLPHQQFIGSGVIFDLSELAMACSIVLLDGRVIADLPLVTLFDGSWVISERTMTPRQINHLLAHASEWEDWQQSRKAAGGDVSGCCSMDGLLPFYLSKRAHASALSPDGRQNELHRDGPVRASDVAAVATEVD